MKVPGEPKAWDAHGEIMDAAILMSKQMRCRVYVRSWKFENPVTKRTIWIYGFGGKAK